MKGWVKHYQANTEKRYNVLSLFFIGKRVTENNHVKVTLKDFASAFKELLICTQKQVYFVCIH